MDMLGKIMKDLEEEYQAPPLALENIRIRILTAMRQNQLPEANGPPKAQKEKNVRNRAECDS